MCLCVNFAYHINQTYAWTLFLLPLLGVLSLALYKALKLPYDYSTDTLVDQMRENDVVSPTLAPGIIIGTCLTILGGGAVGKESSAFQAGASVSETLGGRSSSRTASSTSRTGSYTDTRRSWV